MDPERFRGFSTPELTPKDSLSILPPSPPHKYSKKPGLTKDMHKLGLITVGVVILIALGIGLALLFGHHAKNTNNPPTTTKTTGSGRKSTNSAPQIASTSYTSTNYNASFNYPSSWTVSDNAGAPLTVTSPALQLNATNGSSVLGQIVLSLVSKGTLPKAFGTQAVAVMTSQKVTYAQPSPTQAAASYISFIQYPTTVAVGGLDGIYLTGNFGYQQDQTIPATDIATVDPLAYASFYSCQGDQCPLSSRQPLTITESEWNDANFSAPLLLIFKSFTFD